MGMADNDLEFCIWRSPCFVRMMHIGAMMSNTYRFLVKWSWQAFPVLQVRLEIGDIGILSRFNFMLRRDFPEWYPRQQKPFFGLWRHEAPWIMDYCTCRRVIDEPQPAHCTILVSSNTGLMEPKR